MTNGLRVMLTLMRVTFTLMRVILTFMRMIFTLSLVIFTLMHVILTRYVLNYFITTHKPKLQAHAFGCLKELSPACVLNQDSTINSRLNSPYHTVCRFIRLHEHSTRMRAGSTRMRVQNLYFNMINIFSLNF
jgi:hypothetical protein